MMYPDSKCHPRHVMLLQPTYILRLNRRMNCEQFLGSNADCEISQQLTAHGSAASRKGEIRSTQQKVQLRTVWQAQEAMQKGSKCEKAGKVTEVAI